MKRPNSYAKHALLEMHATLAGEMQTSNERYFKLVRKIREIESVLKMIDPALTYGKGPSSVGSLTRGSREAPSTGAPWTFSGAQRSL
jgi:hypothetical protein